MEISLEDIFLNYSTKKNYDKAKKLSSKQIKDFLDYKINDEIALEICRFIQSNYNPDQMIKLLKYL